jgi:16S rRNA (uracil1498-N3)-methyltransferase
MARRRFFVESVCNSRAVIDGDDARHLSHVLRVEAGQQFEISDNQNVWLAEIETARKERIVFRTIERVAVPEPLVQIDVYVALIKFDRLEEVFEKGTELGVRTITPVESVRSERGLERGAEKRLDRWERIAMEASQQSRRAHLPEIRRPIRFDKAVTANGLRRIFLDEERTGEPILRAVGVPTLGDTVALLIGPEGGWVDHERAAAKTAGWRGVSLGSAILRTETAAVAAIAAINAAYEAV